VLPLEGQPFHAACHNNGMKRRDQTVSENEALLLPGGGACPGHWAANGKSSLQHLH
jgi:hypothetical protein